MDSTSFFASPGPMTSPGKWGQLLDPLPTDVASLCRIVQGLMLHIFWAERMGEKLTGQRQGEVQLRPLSEKLERMVEIDARPLAEARPLGRRLVSNCRDFSLVLAGILRHKGIPARARCGFGRYFMPNHFEDHWVGEYWNAQEGRWMLVDGQLDAFQVDKLGIRFDPLDVPRDQFIVGGEAWRMCRSGKADPDAFGIFDMHGLWFVRGDFVRDVASLNKVELLPWDGWGLADMRDEDLSADDLVELDRMAELTAGDVPDWERVRQAYESDPRWRVPNKIHSYGAAGGGRQEVELALEAD